MARTSRSVNALTQDLRLTAAGAQKNAATIPLLQNPEAAILATVELLLGRPADPAGNSPSVMGVVQQWNIAKTAKVAASIAYRAVLKDGRELALTCVSTLKTETALGRKWNSRWQAAGFTNGSLRVPRKAGGTLHELANYYQSNPNREVRGVNGLDCTAAACRAAATAINQARDARNASRGEAKRAKRALTAGIKAARQRMIGVRAELNQLLKPNDPRWLDYGLQRPSYRHTPTIPEDVTVTGSVSGALLWRWEDAVRADNYRLVVKDLAGNVLVERLVNENQIIIENLPDGLTVTGEVSARNKTGESRSTAPVTATVG